MNKLIAMVLGLSPLVAAGDDSAARMLAEYLRFEAEGCDPQSFRVATPIEARVLRNLPYARVGHSFQTPALARLFEGVAVAPGSNGSLSPQQRQCVERLTRHERMLRRQIPIDPEVEAVLIADPAIFLELRERAIEPGRYRDAQSDRGEGYWSWRAIDGGSCGGDGSPEQAEDCASLNLYCQADSPDGPVRCESIWAG